MAATESIRALRSPFLHRKSLGTLDLFGIAEEQEPLEEDPPFFRLETPDESLSDEQFLTEAAAVLREAAKLQSMRRTLEAYNLLARTSFQYSRISECLENNRTLCASRALALELGTKLSVNLLRQAREDGEATSGVRALAAAALQVVRLDPDVDDAERAHCIANFATLHGYLRDWEIQKALCEEVLALKSSCLAADDPDIVRMKQHLGVACLNLGDWGTAKRLSEEVLEVQLKELGPSHVDVAWTKRHLGVACGNLGDKGSARRLCLEALQVLRAPLDFDPLEVARMLRSLGVAFGNLGNWRLQRQLCEEALGHFREILGDDHIDTAMTKRHLGCALSHLGDDSSRAQAMSICQEALDVLQEHLGNDHLDVARARCTLARACDVSAPGGAETKRELFEEALPTLEAQLGDEHLEVARARINLAAVLGDLGSWMESRRLSTEALVVLKRELGEDDKEVASATSELKAASEHAADTCVAPPKPSPAASQRCFDGCSCWPMAARKPVPLTNFETPRSCC